MRSSPLLLLLAALTVAPTFAARRACADDAADAKDLFGRGRELRGHGDCASALPLFRQAYALYPAALGSLRNVAECQESMGQFASARRAWLDLKRALLTNADPKYEGWDKDADEAAARLGPKVATVTIDMNVAGAGGEVAPSEGVQVTVNGDLLPPSLVGTALDRDPGRYVIRVAGPGVSPAAEQVVDLAPGDAKRVALRVVRTTPNPGDETPRALPAAPPDGGAHRDTTTARTAGWIAIGVGGASLVAAGVSLVVRQAAFDTLSGQQCMQVQGSEQCPPSTASTVDPAASRGRTAATLINVLVPLGVVGVAGGVALLVMAGGGHGAPRAALVLSPMGASAVGRF
jgi:hypothetical protein